MNSPSDNDSYINRLAELRRAIPANVLNQSILSHGRIDGWYLITDKVTLYLGTSKAEALRCLMDMPEEVWESLMPTRYPDITDKAKSWIALPNGNAIEIILGNHPFAIALTVMYHSDDMRRTFTHLSDISGYHIVKCTEVKK